MDWNDDHLLLIQQDVKARLENEAFFSDITVMLRRDGVTLESLESDIGPHSAKSGKTGACAIVLMPALESTEGESPGPCVRLIQGVQVIEDRDWNATNGGRNGTGKSAEQIAANVLNLLHLYIPFHVGQSVFLAEKKPMVPEVIEGREREWVSYTVLVGMQIGFARTNKVGNPDASIGGGLITLTCATPGASIYYTLDGSYPGSVNAEAVLYTVPFNPGAATQVRAVAYKTGSIPSDSILVQLS